jgi:putative oxidoreductase
MMETRVRDRWYDIGMLLLRLGFGLGFLYFHGWGKLLGGPERWLGTGSAVEVFGIGFGHTFFGFMAAVAEAIGGVCIAAGFLFRPAAILIAITMFTAWTGEVTGGRNPAHTFKNMWVAVGLAFMGPGRYSIDHWIRNRHRGPEIELEREVPAG